ncbi:MAG: DUF4830 domain-containing protein [Clostridiales bacterium]|nr:DUF4830 domain-containing protein [Clostridiales bacterium]
MKVHTVQVKKRRVYAAVGLLSALVCLALCLLFVPQAQPDEDMPAAVDTVLSQKNIAFLKEYGWEVDAEPCEIEEVMIPEQFDEVYTEYNRVQKKQGMDLSRYRGKTVKRWTYRVTNYPGYDGEVRANLLCYEEQVIGGDVCATALGGFLHGFSLE